MCFIGSKDTWQRLVFKPRGSQGGLAVIQRASHLCNPENVVKMNILGGCYFWTLMLHTDTTSQEYLIKLPHSDFSMVIETTAFRLNYFKFK